MTYIELQNILEVWGLSWSVVGHRIEIGAQDFGAPMGGDICIAEISTAEQNTYLLHYDAAQDTLMDHQDMIKLNQLCKQLSSTPLDERGSKSMFREKLANAFSRVKSVFA